MKATLRIPSQLVDEIRSDLRRPHSFAFERVGFLFCSTAALEHERLVIGVEYRPIRDDQYIRDAGVGARFDGSSIREAMQVALQRHVSAFHVHLHDHVGVPDFSRTDKREMQALMPCFVNVRPELVHGALILSRDSACARVWSTEDPNGRSTTKITLVGSPMKVISEPHAIRPL